MKVRVVRTESREPNHSYLDYTWTCTDCKTENPAQVRENIILYHKMHELGVMYTRTKCENSGRRHTDGLVLD